MPFPGTVQSGGSKIDVTRLQNFNGFNQSLAATTSYTTLLSITGKGFLRNAIANGLTQNASIRVTIDGVVKFEGTSATNTTIVGILQMDDLVNASATTVGGMKPESINNAIPLNPPTIFSYPYTANALNALTLVAMPVYFYSSLLIEWKVASASSGAYYYSGGYQP